MNLLDLTGEAQQWLESDTPAEAFAEWLHRAPEWIALGFSGLGTKPGEAEWERLVEEQFRYPTQPLLDFLRQR